jgi:Protein of unknown function (DUF2795)
MSFQEAALVQAVLEGTPLPASRSELIEYVQEQEGGEFVVDALLRLPDREYAALDEVGEALAPVQPSRDRRRAHEPRAESGLPPGGSAYTDPSGEPGWVREHGPRD